MPTGVLDLGYSLFDAEDQVFRHLCRHAAKADQAQRVGQPAKAVVSHLVQVALDEHVAGEIGFGLLGAGVNRIDLDAGVITLHILGTNVAV